VTTIEMFERLAADPGALFDRLLIDNVQLKAGAGLTADAEQVAKLFNIDRTNFLNLVAGRAVRIEDCAPCQRARVKAGKTAISLSEYNGYKPFLTFDEGDFIRNDAAADEYKKRFTTYATTAAQIAVVNLHTDLVKVLNDFDKKYVISNKDKQFIAKSLHLYLTEAISGSFMIDEIFIKDNLDR
jgi:hypothetical protein